MECEMGKLEGSAVSIGLLDLLRTGISGLMEVNSDYAAPGGAWESFFGFLQIRQPYGAMADPVTLERLF